MTPIVTRLVRACAVLVLLAAATAPAAAQVVEYYHLDALGSVRAVTNQQRDVVEQHDYLPFGEEWTPTTDPSSLRFTGKERDGETALDYFGGRYYASRIGRFTTVDPAVAWQANLVDPQLSSGYVYVRNNPLRFTDPDGRCFWDLCIAETATAIGVSQATIAAFSATTAATILIWNKREAIGHSVYELSTATGLALRQALDSLHRASRADPYAYPDNYPRLDRSGKAHTPDHTQLPDNVPEQWTREMLEDAASTLRQSIRMRQDELRRLGEDPAHRKRINDEARLLRQIETALKELR